MAGAANCSRWLPPHRPLEGRGSANTSGFPNDVASITLAFINPDITVPSRDYSASAGTEFNSARMSHEERAVEVRPESGCSRYGSMPGNGDRHDVNSFHARSFATRG